MCYIDLINRFWQLADLHGLTFADTTVYFRLLDMANRLGWPRFFSVPNGRAAAIIGTNEKTLAAARCRLVEAGLIAYRPGKHHKDAPTYSFPEKIDKKWIFPEEIQEEIQEEIPEKNQPKQGIYNKNREEKDKNISSSSTHEEEDILAFSKLADDVKANCPIWMQEMAERLRVSQQKICDMIDGDFRLHCLADAHAPHQSLRDFQSHFNRWAIIQLNRPSNPQNALSDDP